MISKGRLEFSVPDPPGLGELAAAAGAKCRGDIQTGGNPCLCETQRI